jgi:hypothetical protein
MSPKGVEVTGGWRKLNDEEITWFLLLAKYKVIGRGRCVGGECGTNERGNAFRILVGEPDGTRMLENPGRK